MLKFLLFVMISGWVLPWWALRRYRRRNLLDPGWRSVAVFSFYMVLVFAGAICMGPDERFGVPLAVLGPIGLFLGVAVILSDRRPGKTSALDPCPRCGYDMQATPGRCPECGWTSRLSGEWRD